MRHDHWLTRFPVGLFAASVGLLALASAWHRAAAFGWPAAQPLSEALAWLGLLVFLVLLGFYLAKCVRHPQVILKEINHLLAAPLTALIPLTLLLIVVNFGQAGSTPWLVFLLCALSLQGALAIHIATFVTQGGLDAWLVTPALYIPPVTGGLIGALAFKTLGYQGWAVMLLGIGLASWTILEARVLHRLFEGAMPEPLRPTIGVELAPPAVTTLTVGTLWPAIPGDVLILGLGIATVPIVTVLARIQWWGRRSFTIGFWSFSFPLANYAAVMVEVTRRGGWPSAIAGVGLACASGVVGLLCLGTLWQLVQRQLIPPPVPH